MPDIAELRRVVEAGRKRAGMTQLHRGHYDPVAVGKRARANLEAAGRALRETDTLGKCDTESPHTGTGPATTAPTGDPARNAEPPAPRTLDADVKP